MAQGHREVCVQQGAVRSAHSAPRSSFQRGQWSPEEWHPPGTLPLLPLVTCSASGTASCAAAQPSAWACSTSQLIADPTAWLQCDCSVQCDWSERDPAVGIGPGTPFSGSMSLDQGLLERAHQQECPNTTFKSETLASTLSEDDALRGQRWWRERPSFTLCGLSGMWPCSAPDVPCRVTVCQLTLLLPVSTCVGFPIPSNFPTPVR